MSVSSHHTGKLRNLSELSLDNSNEGTSARTRPFSYEDIMLRRKNKKVVVEIQDEHAEGDKGEQIVNKAPCDLESERGVRDNRRSIRSTVVSLDSTRVSSRRKEDNLSSSKGSKLVKDMTEQSRDDLKTMLNSDKKNLTGDKTRGKSDRYIDRRERQSNHHSKYGSDEQRLRDLSRKDVSAPKSTNKYEKDRDHKERTDNDDRNGNKKRNTDQSLLDYESQLKKRHTRDRIGKVNHQDRDRRQLDRAQKNKHEADFEEKDRDRDVKKLHSRSSRNSDMSGKNSERNRKDTSQSLYEDPSQMRKRSRSRGLDDDRGRKQESLSFRGHKRSSLGNKEHEVLPSHSSKDRSEKAHPDVERKRISSNGTNSNYRQFSGSSSGLGGYSPRKRKTEAAPRTPSSTNHSPERRDPEWEIKPTEKDVDITVPVVSDMQSSQLVSTNEDKSSSIIPKFSVPVGPIISSHYILSSQLHALDSIQLTQATRPKRRLYVENLPSSASEKTLMECINNFLLSSGVNHIHGTLPCISCIIHQDKGQALLEFLTPEDASAALSFDGRSFSGSTLKIRRPKDFVVVATGGPDNSAEVAYSISDEVENSSNKIFIGGISKMISSEMLMEICKAFGPLKAFHFAHNADIDAQVAFLEYADHLVTLKACAGLNGMKLGGQVLTVVQAIPDTPQLRNGHPPLYGMPENAKPLMEKPTEVLKLKNMLDLEELPSLSEAEAEEILEDIRLECTRFGTVKAVNLVRCSSASATTETGASWDGHVAVDRKVDCQDVMLETSGDELEGFDMPNTLISNTESLQDNSNLEDKPGTDNTLRSLIQPGDCDETKVSNGHSDDNLLVNVNEDETCESLLQDEVSNPENAGCDEKSSPLDRLVDNDKVLVSSPLKAPETPNQVNFDEDLRLEEENSQLKEENTSLASASKLDTGGKEELEVSGRAESNEGTKLCDMIETGCILVEFKRAEASCMAAHCLHGRLFSDRIVSVEYVPLDLYRKRFPK